MPTASSDNSYATHAYAATYFDERLNAEAWTGVSDDEDQHRALIQATRIFDGYLTWNTDDLGEVVISKADPPPEVQVACCEMALVLLQGDTQVKDDMEGLSEVGLSGMSIKASYDKKLIIPTHVFGLISHLATRKEATGSFRIVRS